MLRHFAAAALLLLGLTLAPPARAAWMWTGWEEIAGSQEACLQTAAVALREAGFSATVNPQTTFGWRGADGISIRCIDERRLAVIFIYVTTSSEEGGQLLEQLRGAYRQLGRGPGAQRPPGGGKF